MDPRSIPLNTLLSPDQAGRIHSSKVLLVGAGGIGCELLKDLVVAGVGEIHLVDLDTIDLSNLNRQFLFGSQHIKEPKAMVAAAVAAEFNSNVKIVPYFSDIIADKTFSARWFRSFALVFNALDNAAARRHVNKMCIATDVPLVDVGSEGFAGQSQVILPQKTECYDCFSHPAPKSFPVCTIRSTPVLPVHCIVWAKSFLLPMLFGQPPAADEPSGGETSGQTDENETIEQQELATLKARLADADFAKHLVEKIYVHDIKRLAGNTEMWQTRDPPTPLGISQEFVATDFASGEDVLAQDQAVWTDLENLRALAASLEALKSRQRQGEGCIEFDKDDDDTLDFVTAAANLRAVCFGIQPQTKWETKSIAGNIIPAVASTNAIVGGLATIEALKYLGDAPQQDLRSVYISRSDTKLLASDKLQPRSDSCVICGVARASATAPAEYTLGDLVENLLKLRLGYDDVSLLTDKLLYDPEFDDNLEKSLESLGITDNFVTVVDEDDRRVNLELYVEAGDSSAIDEVTIPLRPTIKRGRDDVDAGADAEADADVDLEVADEVIEL